MLELGTLVEQYLKDLDTEAVTNEFMLVMLVVFAVGLFFLVLNRWRAVTLYAPTLLTSLGILGTFVGIVVGLMGFEVDNIDESIPKLLEGLKTAFITSLGGMALAMVFKLTDSSGLLTRKRSREAESAVGPEQIWKELRSISEGTARLSQAIAGDEDSTLLTQIRMLRADANDHAKQMAGLTEAQNLIAEWHQQNAQTQSEKFDAFEARLWQALDNFADLLANSATEAVIEALKQVITEFNNNLVEQFGDNFKELNAACLKLVQWQDEYREQLADMNEKYGLGVQAIAETKSAIQQISEESKAIPMAMGELKSVLKIAEDSLQELERHLEAFKDMRDRAVEAVPEIKKQMDAMAEDVVAAARQVGEDIKAAGTAVNTALIHGAEEFTNNVNRTNEGLVTASDGLANNSEKIRVQLEDAFVEVNEKVRSLVERIVDQSTVYDKTMTDAHTKLTSDIGRSQAEVTEGLTRMQAQLEGMLNEVVRKQNDEMERAFRTMNQSVETAAARTGEGIDKQLKAMDSAMQQELERVMQAMGSALAQISEKFTGDYRVLVAEMQAIVNERGQRNRS